jgi:hypothetical protein
VRQGSSELKAFAPSFLVRFHPVRVSPSFLKELSTSDLCFLLVLVRAEVRAQQGQVKTTDGGVGLAFEAS